MKKKIKDIYKEVEEEKDDDVITMSKDDFIKEHKNLVSILRKGDKKAMMAEASKQEKELKDETGEECDDDD